MICINIFLRISLYLVINVWCGLTFSKTGQKLRLLMVLEPLNFYQAMKLLWIQLTGIKSQCHFIMSHISLGKITGLAITQLGSLKIGRQKYDEQKSYDWAIFSSLIERKISNLIVKALPSAWVILERCRRISEDGQPGCFVLGWFSIWFYQFY